MPFRRKPDALSGLPGRIDGSRDANRATRGIRPQPDNGSFCTNAGDATDGFVSSGLDGASLNPKRRQWQDGDRPQNPRQDLQGQPVQRGLGAQGGIPPAGKERCYDSSGIPYFRIFSRSVFRFMPRCAAARFFCQWNLSKVLAISSFSTSARRPSGAGSCVARDLRL